MKRYIPPTLLLVLLTALPLWPQAKMDTTFKGSAAIAAHLLRLKAPLPDAKPADLEMRLDINFDFNSSALRPKSKAQLDTLAGVLRSQGFTNTAVELAGHTCDIGRDSVNQVLSQRRVKSAVDYLLSVHKIAASRISHRAYGEKLPLIVGAKNEDERKLNRRVVVYLPENREAIEKLLREMPMTQGFRWGVFRYDDKGKATLVSYDGKTELRSGDRYRVYLRPALPKYVYLYQQDSQGNAQWIYPRADKGLNNPIQPGEYNLPDKESVFELDNTLGTESINLVVLEEPDSLLERLTKSKEVKNLADTVTHRVVVKGIKTVMVGQGTESANRRTQSVKVLAPGERAKSKTQEKKITFRQPGGQDVLTVMAQHREFYMKLNFNHQEAAVNN